jgi:hypothetical protein
MELVEPTRWRLHTNLAWETWFRRWHARLPLAMLGSRARTNPGDRFTMAKKSRGGRMTAAKKRAAKARGGRGPVKKRKAGVKIMKT